MAAVIFVKNEKKKNKNPPKRGAHKNTKALTIVEPFSVFTLSATLAERHG